MKQIGKCNDEDNKNQRRNRISSRQKALNKALWHASEMGDAKKVNRLLRRGADVDSKIDIISEASGELISFHNVMGECLKSALQIAKGEGHAEVVKLLRKKGAEEKK